MMFSIKDSKVLFLVKSIRGKWFTVQSNRILGSFLGQKWDERILNPNGDFSYVIDETVKYWLGTRTPTY